MSNHQYYPNKDMECGRSALANLLVELNDPLTAQIVYDDFRNHKLVNEVGTIHAALFPRITKDLTQGRYTGTIYCHIGSESIQTLTELYDKNQSKLALETIFEDQSTGAICEAPPTLTLSFPAILCIQPKFYPRMVDGEIRLIPYEGNMGHTIVGNGENFIDNGFEMKYNRDELEVNGVFIVNGGNEK